MPILAGAVGVLVVAVIAIAALGSKENPSTAGAVPTPSPTRATTRPASTPRATVAPTLVLAPTLAPDPAPSGPKTFAAGEVITVTSNDEPYLEITVDKVSFRSKYDGQYYDDVPEIKGNVFVQLRVTYKSLENGASYNPFDWNVFVDGVAVDSYTFVSNGPEPQLGSGELPLGRTAQGFLVYEVPKTGRILFSYGSNMFSNEPPVFEVVLRAK